MVLKILIGHPIRRALVMREDEESDKDKEEFKSKVEEMADITGITMGDYKKRIREDNGPGLVPPEIPIERSF